MTNFRILNATVVTMDDAFSVVSGDLAVVDGRIVAIGDVSDHGHLPAVQVGGDYVVPGFVQAHIHLCQTLFRHRAENRPLLRWLSERIWPLEGAHTPDTLAVSAEIGIAELLLSGTTCLLDMGTVHHEDAVAEVVRDSGVRAAIGKAMMDHGDGVPASLLETTADSIDASVALARRWHGAENDRIRYAFAPRFVLSCTDDLQREVGRLSAEHGWLIHTHASEQRDEVAIVEERTGMRNVAWLDALGLTGPRSVFAHGVQLDDAERRILAGTSTTVCHCPSSNLKLGSGVADTVKLRNMGVNVAIGADGAPCNNGLDALVEMRLAHLLQCNANGPGSLPARDVVTMATRNGARALGWSDRIGSIEVGKDADLVRIARDDFRTGGGEDPYAEIVCSGARDQVRDVWVRGERLVRDGRLERLDTARLRERGGLALAEVIERAGV